MIIPIIIATILVGLISIVGILIFFKNQNQSSYLKPFISLAAGSLLAVSLLDLLPEALEKEIFEADVIFATALISILFFFLFERTLHWHHCCCDYENHGKAHTKKRREHLIYFNLIGDAVHNLIDGFLIASAFLLSFHTGIVVTLAVILHEIPQEIADFGILIYSGLSKAKALMYNFFIALTALIGAVGFFYFSSSFQNLIPLMAAFAAGNFIYLATADLIPELHHETNPQKIIIHSIWLLIGVALIFIVQNITPHIL